MRVREEDHHRHQHQGLVEVRLVLKPELELEDHMGYSMLVLKEEDMGFILLLLLPFHSPIVLLTS